MDTKPHEPTAKEYETETKRTVRLATTKMNVNRPIFVDNIDRLYYEDGTPKRYYDSEVQLKTANLSNFHLPFPTILFITGFIMINLVEESNKRMSFHVHDRRLKLNYSGKLKIQKPDLYPNDEPHNPKHRRSSLKLNNEWTISVTTEVLMHNGEMMYGSAMNHMEGITVAEQLMSAIHYFAPFCIDKEKFVVESRIAQKKKGKIKAKGKSIYHIMHVKKILKHFTSTGNSGKPITKGYPRRTHPREYRSDRWVNMQGKTIMIPSTWVGPKTTISKGRLYKVHTDIY